MALPSYLYGNPERILEAKQNRECRGCRYLEEVVMFGATVKGCKLKPNKKQHQIRKCNLYGEARK